MFRVSNDDTKTTSMISTLILFLFLFEEGSKPRLFEFGFRVLIHAISENRLLVCMLQSRGNVTSTNFCWQKNSWLYCSKQVIVIKFQVTLQCKCLMSTHFILIISYSMRLCSSNNFSKIWWLHDHKAVGIYLSNEIKLKSIILFLHKRFVHCHLISSQ